IITWPDQFWNRRFWVLKESVYSILKLAVALHLSYRAFRAFPGAGATARLLEFLVLGTTAWAVLWNAPWHMESERAWLDRSYAWQQAVQAGTIWLFTSTALLITWYRIPMRAFQRAILMGFTAYLVVFSSLLHFLERKDWAWGATFEPLLAVLSAVNNWAYM